MSSEFIVAVHGLVFLHHKGETLCSDKLAENICTNPVTVRRVMSTLGKAGIIDTKIGRTDGGYSFTKAGQVTLGDVAEALNASFVKLSWHSGDPDMNCQIASGMAGYMDGLYKDMDEACKKRLAQITIADVEKELFHNKENKHK